MFVIMVLLMIYSVFYRGISVGWYIISIDGDSGYKSLHIAL